MTFRPCPKPQPAAPKPRKWLPRATKPIQRSALKPSRTPIRAVGAGKRRRMKAYSAHLRSPFWKALRKLVFERDGYRCVDCGEEAGYFVNGKRDMRGLECDHETYVRMFQELPQDCRTRCRPCHRKKHAGQWWKRIPMSALLAPEKSHA